MPDNTRWPDFRLGTTLRSLMGSQSSALEKNNSSEPSSSQTGLHLLQQDEHREELHRGSQRRRETQPQPDHITPSMAEALTDPDGRSIDGLGDFDTYSNDGQPSAADADFGALEVFDSNASEPPFSSQINGRAPAAVMSEDAVAPVGKLSKKDKKRGSSHRDADVTHQPAEDEAESSKKRKKSKRKAEVPESQHAISRSHATDNQPDEVIIPSSQAKKKRKLSDSAEGKRNKKKRSHSQEETVQGTQDAGETHNAPATFLRKRKGKGVESTIYEEGATSSDPRQGSPSAARADRRSQSREARSRGGSVSLEANVQDAPEVALLENGNDSDRDLGTEGVAVDTDNDVEALAREAWNEHRNAQNGTAAAANDVDMADVDTEGVLDGAAGDELVQESPKRSRSTRKKAKPTYFEQPAEDVAAHLADELPSPSANGPKPRNRTKRATKKREKAPKLSQSMRGGSADGDEDAPRGRKNRMAGFTQGRFSDEELALIANAVENFRSENELSQEAVNEMIQAPGGTTAGDAHAELWVRIFAECPDRHRQKVINIARKKFHNFVARGTWTPEQDAELAQLISIHGTQWAKIAHMINRHPEDIRDRYRNYLICGDAQRKDAWDEIEEARLTQYVIEAMDAVDALRAEKPDRALLQRAYEELIDWQNISERMDRTRSRLQCITKWKSLNLRTHGKDKLVSHAPDASISFGLEKARRQIAAMPEEERYRFVLAIQAASPGRDSKIPWQRLVDKQFRNAWHRPTLGLLWFRLRQTVPGGPDKTARDCAQYLVEQYNSTGELPELGDEKFDDTEEMMFMQTMPAPGTPHKSGPRMSGVSSELVGESDRDDDDEEAHNGNAEEEDTEIKIDPALMTDSPPAEVAAPTAPPAKTATPAKKTGTGRRPGATKRGGKAAAAARNQDPIEEVDTTVEDAGVDVANGSDVDEGNPRKRKTPSKFKSSARAKKASKAAAAAAAVAEAPASSDMEDMGDIPARSDS